MRELDRQNDGLLQRLLRGLQSRDVVPFHVRLVRDDGTRETSSQLLDLWIGVIVVPLPSVVQGELRRYER